MGVGVEVSVLTRWVVGERIGLHMFHAMWRGKPLPYKTRGSCSAMLGLNPHPFKTRKGAAPKCRRGDGGVGRRINQGKI